MRESSKSGTIPILGIVPEVSAAQKSCYRNIGEHESVA